MSEMDIQSIDGANPSDEDEVDFDRIENYGKKKKQFKYSFKFSVDQTVFNTGIQAQKLFCGILVEVKQLESQNASLLFFPGMKRAVDFDKKTASIEVQIDEKDLEGYSEFRYRYAVSVQSNRQVGSLANKQIACSNWIGQTAIVKTHSQILIGSTENVAQLLPEQISKHEATTVTSSRDRVDSHHTESKNQVHDHDRKPDMASNQPSFSDEAGSNDPSNSGPSEHAKPLLQCHEPQNVSCSGTSSIKRAACIESSVDKSDRNSFDGPLVDTTKHTTEVLKPKTESKGDTNSVSVDPMLNPNGALFNTNEPPKAEEERTVSKSAGFSSDINSNSENPVSVSQIIRNRNQLHDFLPESQFVIQAVVDKKVIELGENYLVLSLVSEGNTSQGEIVAANKDWVILSFNVTIDGKNNEYVPYFYEVRNKEYKKHKEVLPDGISSRYMSVKEFKGELSGVKIKHDGVISWIKEERRNQKTPNFPDTQSYETSNLNGFKIYCKNFASGLLLDFNLDRFHRDMDNVWSSLSSVRYQVDRDILILKKRSAAQEALEVLIDIVKNGSSPEPDMAIASVIIFMCDLTTRGLYRELSEETIDSVNYLVQNADDELRSRLATSMSAKFPPEAKAHSKFYISTVRNFIEMCKKSRKQTDTTVSPQNSKKLQEINEENMEQSKSQLTESQSRSLTRVEPTQTTSEPVTDLGKHDPTKGKSVVKESEMLKSEPEQSNEQVAVSSVEAESLNENIPKRSSNEETARTRTTGEPEARDAPQDKSGKSHSPEVTPLSMQPGPSSANSSKLISRAKESLFSKSSGSRNSLPKMLYFSSPSDKNKNTTPTKVQQVISNKKQDCILKVSDKLYKILTVVDTEVTQIGSDLRVFMQLEKELYYGKTEVATDNWAILCFEFERKIFKNDNPQYFFGVASKKANEVKFYRETLPGNQEYRSFTKTDTSKSCAYTGTILWRAPEAKAWGIFGRTIEYVKGQSSFLTAHSNAFEIYCTHYATKFALDLDIDRFVAYVRASWQSLSSVHNKKTNKEEIVFTGEPDPQLLLDTMIGVVESKCGDLAVVALLLLTGYVHSSTGSLDVIKEVTFPSRSREVILQDLARFLQKRVILQDLARWRLSCKILQDGGYLARILKESCKITIPKFLSKNTKKITEIRCKIKKIVSRTRIQNFK